MLNQGSLNGTLRWPLVAACLSIPLIACDQIGPARYEITKDQTGRTLRLDKRTGEVAIIDGGSIAKVRDAKAVEAENSAKLEDLAHAKFYPPVFLGQFGLAAHLRTSWQDGKLLYAVSFKPFGKPKQAEVGTSVSDGSKATRTNADWTKFERHTWTLIVEDSPFELARQPLTFSRIVDDEGKTDSHEAKGSVAMSSETYRRIDVWNVMWRARY